MNFLEMLNQNLQMNYLICLILLGDFKNESVEERNENNEHDAIDEK